VSTPSVEVTEHDRLYWQYEYDVAAQYLVPLLRSWGVRIEGATLLDVGCGDGGGLCAFVDAGMVCKGFDIEEHRIQLAQVLAGSRQIDLVVGNIHEKPFDGETFDLIVLHDVFEHLDRKEEALNILHTYLAPRGHVLITFPPYYSAFGAHQQLLRSPLGKVPFVHLIPFMMSNVIPSLTHEPEHFITEIQKLGRQKMGIAKF
jgi:2-polyprenyl-3-methyl-5-hydroxy-6-metoxy-1,4-benzoquinol methylase